MSIRVRYKMTEGEENSVRHVCFVVDLVPSETTARVFDTLDIERAQSAFLRAAVELAVAEDRHGSATEGLGDEEETERWLEVVGKVYEKAKSNLVAIGGNADDMPLDERRMWLRLKHAEALLSVAKSRARSVGEQEGSWWHRETEEKQKAIDLMTAELATLGDMF